MVINSLSFQAGGQCTFSLAPAEGWLCATWAGHVTPADALSGAQNYLVQARALRCRYLLNDNTSLSGPWFESLTWLDEVWLPQAIQAGLRYLAHVVQADTNYDILTHNCLVPLTDAFELQLFDDVASAREWLQTCQALSDAPTQPA